MISQDEARARVARGAAHLDALFPDWPQHVKVLELDMSRACSCVLGQLHGDYNEAIANKAIFPRHIWQTVDTAHRAAISLGFDVGHTFVLTAESRQDYQRLQDAWIEAIAARLHPVSDASEAAPIETPATA